MQLEKTSEPSKGYMFAVPMLIFMLMEVGVPLDAWLSGKRVNVYVWVYFGLKAVFCVVQVIGILLVVKGRYRTGGILQIVASAIHVPELLGIFGVIGGVKAYRYPKALAHRLDGLSVAATAEGRS